MTLPASGQKWLDTLETMRATIAELAAERDRYRDALVARHGGEPLALLSELDAARAERDGLRSVCELVAGNLAAWADKREEAPQSAAEHMDEAMHALVRFRRDGGYSEAASRLRLEMWHGDIYAERDAAVAKCAELERELAAANGKLAGLCRSLRRVHARIEVGIRERGSEGCKVFATLLELHELGPAAIAAAEQGGAS